LRLGICSLQARTASLILLLAGPLFAGPPSDTLLPASTKGYVSVPRPGEFKERWLKTQWGQMLNDEVMQPFMEDLRKQLQEEYQAVEDKLGIAWDDLEGVPAGEMSLSIIERKGEDAALAITIDVTDHAKQADGLLAAIEKRFGARGGRKQTSNSGGATLHVFTVPTQAGSPPQTTVYFLRDNLLCGVDDRDLADAMLKRFAGGAKDNLASVPAYVATMERCAREAKDLKPEARWFVEPFGFIFAARTLQEDTAKREGQDFAKIFQQAGFDAITGVGGYFNQLVVEGEIEFVHRTSIYAPPIDSNDPLRWTKSMRMLQLPNVAGFEPQSFVPRMSAGYRTVSIETKAAFDNIGPLFDGIKEHEDAWVNSLDGWKNDPFGPKVDVEKEIVANLGQRITLVTDYTLPIDANCERTIFAVEAQNEKQLAAAIAKWMQREPNVERREVGEFIVWERVPASQEIEELQVEVPGFESFGSDDEEDAATAEEDGDRVLPNSAVTVALGHLIVVSDIEYLKEILGGFGQQDRLAGSLDYQQVVGVLNQLAPGERSALTFGRSDEEFRPIFELVRQNKMPESKTMLGQFLNKILTTEHERQEGILRKQQIDGSSLPSFETVRRYFGPHGGVLHSEKDGWFLTGTVLNKEAP
jgi:hypothetical protein